MWDSFIEEYFHHIRASQRSRFMHDSHPVPVTQRQIGVLADQEDKDIPSIEHYRFMDHCGHIVDTDDIVDPPRPSKNIRLHRFKIVLLYALHLRTDVG
jgi:hypothetical protein